MKIVSLFLLLTLSNLVLKAQVPDIRITQRPAGKALEHLQVRDFLNKTNLVITSAQDQVKQYKNYTGHFASALSHQRYARQFFLSGNYRSAIHHSVRARSLSFYSIQENYGVILPEWELSPEEKENLSDLPSNEELDKTLDQQFPDAPYRDEELINIPVIDLEIGENQ